MGGSTRFIFEEAGLHCDGAVKTSGADLRFHECVKDCLGVSRSAPLREDDAGDHEGCSQQEIEIYGFGKHDEGDGHRDHRDEEE